MAEKKRRARKLAVVASALGVCAVAGLVALGVNMGLAGARSNAATGFGLGSTVVSTDTTVGALAGSSSASAAADAEKTSSTLSVSSDKQMSYSDSSITKSTSCDISTWVNAIETAREEERLAAEEAERKAEEEAIARALEAQAQSQLDALEPADFTVGKAAFVEEWGARIDAYLAGSPLEGYGETFARAAFEYGVDPRFSPAISNTESTKGANCYTSYNAWGWMGTLGSDWESSIYAHVKGLADGYGYTISLGAAQAYCPPNYANWYSNTLSEMAKM